jgi:hypothetical protein
MRRLFILLVAVMFLASTGILVAKSKSAPSNTDGRDPSAAANDAQWTLYCRAIAGPDHVARSSAIKEDLVKNTPLKDWYVLHEEDQSVIYYGHYQSTSDPKDPKESARAQADRKQVSELKDQQGNKIFAACLFEPIDSPDPISRSEWDLRNAKGFWSVEVGVYKDDPRRKQAAVDSVKALREAGIEAYYYHGPTASSVCIGAWPREALREQEPDDKVFQDQTHDILVLPGVIDVPKNVDIRNRDGEKVNAVAPRTDIVDPSLKKVLEKYPTRALNGEDYIKKVVDPQTKLETEVRQPSVLVPIPQQTASLLRTSQPPPTLVMPTTPSQTPGAGTLKSIGQ